ncbi:MAG: MBL fold metallo-hydrolase RNA specificity domain-containing protein [Spirochaetota bacterium]
MRVRAQVQVLDVFSAHADYRDILACAGSLDRSHLKGVFLVHGEPEAQDNLASLLREQVHRVVVSVFGERYPLA